MNQSVVKKSKVQSPKNTNKIIFIVIGLCLILIVIIAVVFYLMVSSGLSGAKNRVKDAKVTSDVQESMTALEYYYSNHDNSYSGFTVNSTLQNDAIANGSEVVINYLSGQDYVISAKLPSSHKYYCVDSNGFNGEITKSPSGSTCQ